MQSYRAEKDGSYTVASRFYRWFQTQATCLCLRSRIVRLPRCDQVFESKFDALSFRLTVVEEQSKTASERQTKELEARRVSTLAFVAFAVEALCLPKGSVQAVVRPWARSVPSTLPWRRSQLETSTPLRWFSYLVAWRINQVEEPHRPLRDCGAGAVQARCNFRVAAVFVRLSAFRRAEQLDTAVGAVKAPKCKL